MVRIGWLAGSLALGCAGLDPEALLVQHDVDGACRIEKVTPGQPEVRVLGVVPSKCAFKQILLAPDGSRLLLARFPMSYEVNLATGAVQTLPKPQAYDSPALPDPELHLDGQGTVLWEIVQGEGKAEYDSEGWPSWPALRYHREGRQPSLRAAPALRGPLRR
jgi:hypothetical protein